MEHLLNAHVIYFRQLICDTGKRSPVERHAKQL